MAREISSCWSSPILDTTAERPGAGYSCTSAGGEATRTAASSFGRSFRVGNWERSGGKGGDMQGFYFQVCVHSTCGGGQKIVAHKAKPVLACNLELPQGRAGSQKGRHCSPRVPTQTLKAESTPTVGSQLLCYTIIPLCVAALTKPMRNNIAFTSSLMSLVPIKVQTTRRVAIPSAKAVDASSPPPRCCWSRLKPHVNHQLDKAI